MLNNINFMGQNLYYLAFYFIIFSFLGWLMETCLCSITEKKFVFRGFLSSPVCPIYGTGIVIIILLLFDIRDNTILLFVGGAILATVLEYIVGAVLEKVFKAKWWDYSDRKINLDGYVCLSISLCWGALCVVMIKWVVPYLDKLISRINEMWGNIFIYIFFAIIIIDTVITVYNLVGLNKILDELSYIREEFKVQFEKTTFYLKTEEFREKYEDFKQETVEKLSSYNLNQIKGSKPLYETWKEAFEKMAEDFKNDPNIIDITNTINEIASKQNKKINNYSIIQKRILDAFPNYKPKNNKEAFKELKEKMKEKKNKTPKEK